MKRTIVVVALVASSASIHTVSAAPLDSEPVLTGPADQYLATADNDRLAWTERGRSKRTFARARGVGSTGPGRIVNDHRRGYSYTGGFNDGDLLFQQVRAVGRRFESDLRVFDPVSSEYRRPPAGVNTTRWEWRGSWSDTHVLFGRNGFVAPTSPWSIVLFDRISRDEKVLASVKNKCACIFPGNLTDQYATWTVCRGTCQVWVYDIVADDAFKVPNPLDKHQYNGSVTPAGDVYFVRSGNGCGVFVKIVRWTIGGPPDQVLVSSLPDHREVRFSVFAFTRADTHTDVYFDRFDCRRNVKGDVFVIHDAETATLRGMGGASIEGGREGGKLLFLADARPRKAIAA